MYIIIMHDDYTVAHLIQLRIWIELGLFTMSKLLILQFTIMVVLEYFYG